MENKLETKTAWQGSGEGGHLSWEMRGCERGPSRYRSGLQAPPAFIDQPKEEYFQEVGRELLIPCSARGDPPPTVSWAKVRLLNPDSA